MNRTNIEFCDFTWNPIVGCQIGCSYCWARRMNRQYKFIPSFNIPKFFEERLTEPYDRWKPAKIFVCSMSDIFSPGIEDRWIKSIIQVAVENERHTFQFLTKRPEFYLKYQQWIPANCWLGTSIDYAHNKHRVDILSSCSCKFTRFVLVEPLLSDMSAVDFSKIDLLFVGAQTGPGAVIPHKDWINSITHHCITYKENIKSYL